MDDAGLPHDRDTCHRLALDHVLGLIADAGWSDGLVVRGSMMMTAYAGPEAREPADLDFVVIDAARPVDAEQPYPYVDELSTIQQWPEVADGAGRAELWADEEFDTGGCTPRVSPEGLQWVMGWSTATAISVDEQVRRPAHRDRRRLQRHPHRAGRARRTDGPDRGAGDRRLHPGRRGDHAGRGHGLPSQGADAAASSAPPAPS